MIDLLQHLAITSHLFGKKKKRGPEKCGSSDENRERYVCVTMELRNHGTLLDSLDF